MRIPSANIIVLQTIYKEKETILIFPHYHQVSEMFLRLITGENVNDMTDTLACVKINQQLAENMKSNGQKF